MLRFTSFESHIVFMQTLLEGGADIEAENSVYRATLLDAAAIGGNKEVVRLLLNGGACAQRSLVSQYATGGESLAIFRKFLPMSTVPRK